ncbi:MULTISPECIES: hypothetical protein [unclassified Leptotrichia]|jgi:hypothetical protein|uniref:hypothetical protein n=1 Tax=unclassified Leptotrichia TaxID=2633022 RepID=UPI0003AE6373|nr:MULTISPECIES: hypothetical protein [unclassified Leptotrichia]ERL25051.1 hypothetical protein HMPREF9108_01911 [Leptotrichia sp. oral taxon 225 str. F0581]WLD75438.1 hypothetical protein QU666_06085 [Leptotrichia sp. HMT-225]
MRKIGNIILGALIMLVGLVILTESNDNHIDIKISDNENLSVDNIKNVTAVTEKKGSGKKVKAVIIEFDKTIKNEKLSKNAVTVTQKSIAKKNIDDPEDEPLANTTETKVNREISKIYASDKIDENGKEGNGKYLYVELAEDTKNNNIVAQTDLDSVKISVSQDNNNYFIGSKSFNVNGK